MDYPILFARAEDCDPQPKACSGGCGDGLLVSGEECDDGNLADGDGCSSSCMVEAVCGDGIVGNLEDCDNGSLNGDIANSCTAQCRSKPLPCPLSPLEFCMRSGRAKLLALEHKEGKEALKVSLVAIEEELTLEGLPKSTKGFSFVDKSGASSGINKLVLLAGSPGKGKAIVKGKNNAKKGLSNPPLVSGLLWGDSSPTVQLISESGLCIGGNMRSGEEKKPGLYNAKS